MHMKPILACLVVCTACVPILGGASPPTLEQSHPWPIWGQPAPLQSPGPAMQADDLHLQLLDRSRVLPLVPLPGARFCASWEHQLKPVVHWQKLVPEEQGHTTSLGREKSPTSRREGN